MSRQHNNLMYTLNEIVEMVLDVKHEASKKLKRELSFDSEIYRDLEQLTNQLVPGATIERLSDDDYEELATNRDWMDLYETWNFYNDMFDVVKDVEAILNKAVGSIESLD